MTKNSRYLRQIEDPGFHPDDEDPMAVKGKAIRPKAYVQASTVGYKRNVTQREFDKMEVAELYLTGHNYQEISDVLSHRRGRIVTVSMIQKDLITIHARWQASYLSDYDKIKARELARIDVLERAYWEGWTKSKEKKETIRTMKVDDKTGTENSSHSYQRMKAEKQEENRDGDPAFLAGVQWCIEQRCKIMGFNAPQKINVTNWRAEAEKSGVNPGEVFNEMVGRFVSASMDGRDGEGSLGRSPTPDKHPDRS